MGSSEAEPKRVWSEPAGEQNTGRIHGRTVRSVQRASGPLAGFGAEPNVLLNSLPAEG